MISQSQRILLESLKSSLFDVMPQYSTEVNWGEVVTEAKTQTVLGLISNVIPFRDESSEQIKAFYMRILYEQNMLLKLLDSSQIPCVILKGAAASVYYPKPYLRTMGDIDILVQRDKFPESLKLLEANGYVLNCYKEKDKQISGATRELAYIKNGICVEIHQSFSSPGVNVDSILEEAINRRVYFELNGYNFPMLPVPENGLVLIGHINQHLKHNVLGLRQIIDWEMYINSIKDKSSWLKPFVPLLESTDLLLLAAYVTRMCYLHLGLPENVSFGIDVDDSLVDELLEIVLNDGNFGRRVFINESLEEVSVKKASYGINREGFFNYFIHIGLSTSDYCKKHPSNKPVAFVYGMCRQFRKGLKALCNNKNVGKKMVEGKRLYSQHSKRQELYKKLGVRTGK